MVTPGPAAVKRMGAPGPPERRGARVPAYLPALIMMVSPGLARAAARSMVHSGLVRVPAAPSLQPAPAATQRVRLGAASARAGVAPVARRAARPAAATAAT